LSIVNSVAMYKAQLSHFQEAFWWSNP